MTPLTFSRYIYFFKIYNPSHPDESEIHRTVILAQAKTRSLNPQLPGNNFLKQHSEVNLLPQPCNHFHRVFMCVGGMYVHLPYIRIHLCIYSHKYTPLGLN